MTSQRFRIYFAGTPATQDQLDRVEEISVDQQADAAWEARIQIAVCLDDHGDWAHLEESYIRDFSRVRIELQIDTAPWVPLIDGPLVGYHSDLHSEPGKSLLTLVVHDDSVLLNRTAGVEVTEGETDSDLARRLLASVPGIEAGDIQATTPSSDPLGGAAVRRETVIRFLRRLARRNGFHVYVLPGDTPGHSRGCFRPYATDPTSGLPTLVLLGDDRNIENFSAANDAQAPARFTGRTVTVTDRSTVDRTSDFSNVALLGAQPSYDDASATGQFLLGPHQLDEDPDRATRAATERSAYGIRATGRVLPDCFDGVLRAYDVVAVKAGPMQHSGTYVVTRVRHVINRSLHTQEFTLLSNARSAVNAGAGSPLAGIF
jgi:hypothetical protein